MNKRPLHGGSIKVDAEMQAHIGEELRLLFDAALLQSAPDRFKELLQILEIQKGEQE